MDDCIFCKVAGGKAHSWKVCGDGYTYAFLDINPVNEYHKLVIPKKHYENIFDIPEDEAAHIMKPVKKVVKLYNEKLGLKICRSLIVTAQKHSKISFIFISIVFLDSRETGRM